MNWFVKNVIKNRFYLLSFGLIIIGWAPFFYNNKTEFSQEEIQSNFSHLEKEADLTCNELYEELLDGKKPTSSNSSFFVHIYQGDSLIYWNTNKLPISKFAQPQFPTKGRAQLQNGWYYASLKEDDRFKVCVSFLIKQKYSYTNSNLLNQVNPSLCGVNFDVGLQEDEGLQIRDLENNFVFSALPNESTGKYILTKGVFIFSFLGVLFFLIGLTNSFQQYKWRNFIPLFFLLIIRAIIEILDFSTMSALEVGITSQIPNEGIFMDSFLDLLFNILLIAVLAISVLNFFKNLNRTILWWWILIALIIFWFITLELIQIIVGNTGVPIDLHNVFSLNENTLILFIVLGVLFYSIQSYYEWFAEKLLNKNESSRVRIIITFISLILFSLLRIVFYGNSFIVSLVPLLLFITHLFFYTRHEFSQRMGYQSLTIAFFTILIVLSTNEYNDIKDGETRKKYAEQLSIERNLEIEKRFLEIKSKLATNAIIKNVSEYNQVGLSISSFGDILEKKLFKGEWESYEIRFDLTDSIGNSFFSKDASIYETTLNVIENHGKSVNNDSTMYFITNEFNGISYIIHYPLKVKNTSILFIATLKSKKIPEEIGFPRLLLSEKSKAVLLLDEYSIAKYASGKLTKSFGPYSYEVNYLSTKSMKNKGEFFEKDGYSHYLLDLGDNNAIILSKKKSTWLTYSTSFSYVFTFWGLMLIIAFGLGVKNLPDLYSFSLAFKIQFVLVLVVVIALLLFGTGSGIFVSDQYEDYTSKNINEKLNSVSEELKGKVSLKERISIENEGGYLENTLIKLSKVFVTDINIYDTQGYLVASSRPKLFNLGLLSEQINPKAFEELKYANKSYYKHNEQIGTLSYLSAYMPIYNAKGKLLGYTNLQYFGQQKEYENQIQQFIVAIINVFILLIAISITLALFISNWLTSPLRILKEKLSTLRLGTQNEKIDYKGNDEIGLIVKAYNAKLDELELAAKQIASSERESAWRDMAKQVAHEIKNPLTPMKLSIQQLMRVYDPSDIDMTERIKNLMNSLIEQIDGLSRIANEFSNFAKMPEPIREKHDIVPIVQNCISVFQNDTTTEFLLITDLLEIPLLIDKGQWIQVLNNLLKNAIQATINVENGRIVIRLNIANDEFILEVEDNGVGISDEDKKRVFTPYFTTKNTGSGIGLSVVKQILDYHAATIDYESSLGKGTKFRIKMPIKENL